MGKASPDRAGQASGLNPRVAPGIPFLTRNSVGVTGQARGPHHDVASGAPSGPPLAKGSGRPPRLAGSQESRKIAGLARHSNSPLGRSLATTAAGVQSRILQK